MIHRSCVRVAAILSFALMLAAQGGCASASKANANRRTWTCSYIETCHVSTNPPGCQVYIQGELVGDSPCSGEIEGTPFKFIQERSSSSAEWSELTPNDFEDRFYVVKAFKDGYNHAEQVIRLTADDQSFLNAIEGVEVIEDRLYAKYYGERHIELTLHPTTRGSASSTGGNP